MDRMGCIRNRIRREVARCEQAIRVNRLLMQTFSQYERDIQPFSFGLNGS